ncbi:hypothetical protein Tco_1155463 [Tanacetum coccineum]
MPLMRNMNINDVYERIMARMGERLDQFGDGSSFFAEPEEWEDDGVADDDYKEAQVFDKDQYEDVIEDEKGFIDNYPNFQGDANNVLCSGVVYFTIPNPASFHSSRPL